MGKRTTTTGYWRQYGDNTRTATAGVVPSVLQIKDVSALLAGAGLSTGQYLPKGAIPLRVDIHGKGTGGTSPLLDVGLELSTPDDDGLVDGAAVDADSSVALGSSTDGVLIGTELTETAEVTVSDGGGTNATGGTFDLFIWYIFADDGADND